MESKTQTIVIKANKMWTVFETILGLFFIIYSPLAFKQTLLKIIFIILGLYLIVQAFLVWRASISLKGSVLTARYTRTTSLDLTLLRNISSGSVGGSGGDGIKLTDKSGNYLVLRPRLFQKNDIKMLLATIRPYFPAEPVSLPWLLRTRLKRYGIK